jgi:putative membrane-bound dehydrogenase-like protein
LLARISAFLAVALLVHSAAVGQAPTKFIGAPVPSAATKASPLTPEEQRAAFTLPPGFEIELVAAEPEVPKPVTVVFDDAGRMWTMTAVEYPVDANENLERAKALYAGHGRDRVLIFDTPTAPGRQKPRVFADGLAIPLGLLPWKDGCLVQHGTDIVFLRDTDGDGRADQREVFLTGFGIEDSHLFPHQFTRGPDDWIYLAQGAFNYSKVKGKDGRVVQFDQTKMARVRPDGTGFEIVCWGPNNIWGFVIDRHGEMFIQEANDLAYPVVPFFIGANYPGIGMHKARPYAPWQAPLADFAMGGTGLSGLALSDDLDGFPPPYRDVMFVANPITSHIQAIKIHREGAGHRLELLPDFINTSDPMFRPVAIHFGPDSCLYIVDWCNKIISHNEVPRDHPDRDKTSGRIWRVRHQSMARRAPPDLTRVPEKELVKHLGAANTWEGRAAWHQIVDRGAVGLVPELKKVVESSARRIDERVLGLWSLEGLRKAPLRTLQRLTSDPSRAIRREAVRVLATQGFAGGDIVNVIQPLLEDPDPQVRAEIIRTLDSIPQPTVKVMELLARMAKPALDGPKVKAQQNGEWVNTGAAADRDFERYLARAAMEAHPQVLAAFLDSAAARFVPLENRLLAWLALGGKEGAIRLAEGLSELKRQPSAEEFTLLANHSGEPTVGKTIAAFLTNPAWQRNSLEALLKARQQLTDAALPGFIGAATKSLLARESNDANFDLALRLASAFKLAALEPEVVAFVTRTNLTEERRLAALRALRELGANQLPLFQQFALSGKPGNPVQREAVSALAASRTERAATMLLEMWPVLPANLRKLAVDRLTSSATTARLLLHAVKAGQLDATELDDYALDKLRIVVGDDPTLAEVRQALAKHARPVLRLNGRNDDSVDASIDLVGPFTVETWIRLDPGIDNNDGILAAPGQADFNFHDARFRVWDRDHHDVIIAQQRIQPDEWTHVAVTRNARGNFKVFLNGELDNERGKPSTNDYRGLGIGRTLPGGGTAGLLAEFRVWNFERTADEIRTAYRASFQGEPLPQGLVRYYPGDESWGPLHGQAKVIRTADFPPLLTATEARALAEKFAHFRQLAEKPGDLAHGREIFKTSCMVCHSVQGEGGQIGPTLNGAFANGLEALLRNVLTPNAAVESGYYRYRVETTDGELLEGFLASQTDDAIVLRQQNVEDQRLPRRQIKHAAFTRQSMMPEGLLEALKPEEVPHLFAFLRTLK